jgi:hypothetical protein
MTANEMFDTFLLRYDKVTNFAAPGYEPIEVENILNDSYERFVKTTYSYRSNRYKEGFEETEKRRKDLKELIRGPRDLSGNLVTSLSLNQNDALQFGQIFNLPDDCWLVISEYAVTDVPDCTLPNSFVTVPIKPITHDEYVANIRNPEKKPYVSGIDGLVWRLDLAKENPNSQPRHELVNDGTFLVTAYHLRYIKKLTRIVIDLANPANQINCELDDSTHSEIVDIAVRRAAGITDERQYQLKLNEELTKE